MTIAYKAKKKNKNVSQAPPHLSETPRITPFYRLKKKKINKIAHLLQIFVFVFGDQGDKAKRLQRGMESVFMILG